jgi:hypothetical protein
MLLPLGKLKGLSALNLDGNPLDHPPFEIVKQGVKAIQQYLRDEKDDNEKISSDHEEHRTDNIADVWASSDEENDNSQRRKLRSPPHPPPTVLNRPSLIFLRKSKYFK